MTADISTKIVIHVLRALPDKTLNILPIRLIDFVVNCVFIGGLPSLYNIVWYYIKAIAQALSLKG